MMHDTQERRLASKIIAMRGFHVILDEWPEEQKLPYAIVNSNGHIHARTSGRLLAQALLDFIEGEEE